MSNQAPEVASPEDYFEAHCSRPGAVILVEIVDTEGQTIERGIFTKYKTANAWSEQFHDNDSVEKCAFIPQYLDYPAYDEERTQLH